MKFSIFKNFPELRYGLSAKKDGSMNSPITIDNSERRAIVERNRRLFLAREGFNPNLAVSPYLIHGGDVAIVDGNNYNEQFRKDGFVTAVPNKILTITIGDCFPLFMDDSVKKVIGLAHAGWKGIAAGIVENTIETFVSAFGSDPKDIFLGIGPGIQKCCFEIRDDILDTFKPYSAFVKEKGNGVYTVNLQGIIIEKAIHKGLRIIEADNECTFCEDERYFSYRRDKPGPIPEVMLAYIIMV